MEGQIIASGFRFVECPRWHRSRLWVSDMWGHAVHCLDPDGGEEVVHRFSEHEEPGGLGWLPDGRLLVVGMLGRVIYRLDGRDAVVHADLSEHTVHPLNDMVVADDGTAYVTQFGYDVWGGGDVEPSAVHRVAADGAVSVLADGFWIPNGIALSEDGRMLLVAEPGASRLTRLSISMDGSTADRELWVEIEPAPGVAHAAPDGLCLDVSGGAWVADFLGRRVVHVDAAGTQDRVITIDGGHPMACVLGGADRRSLFVCVSRRIAPPHRSPDAWSWIERFAVSVAGTGRP